MYQSIKIRLNDAFVDICKMSVLIIPKNCILLNVEWNKVILITFNIYLKF